MGVRFLPEAPDLTAMPNTAVNPPRGSGSRIKSIIIQISSIFLLILSIWLPVVGYLGLIVMWLGTSWPKVVKAVITIPFALLLAFVYFSNSILSTVFPAIRLIEVSGNSMYPAYQNGSYVLVDVLSATDPAPAIGETVVYRSDTGHDVMKRIAGVPGDAIALRDGVLYRNHEPADESSYLPAGTVTDHGHALLPGQEYEVPANSFLLLGDNRSQSLDSRQSGFINRARLIGTVRGCVWNCR